MAVHPALRGCVRRSLKLRGELVYPVVVTDRRGVVGRLVLARREVLVACTFPVVTGGVLGAFGSVDREGVRQGVRYRVLFPDRARLNADVMGRLRALALVGVEVRTVPDVPLEAVVVDGVLAMLPGDRGGERPDGVLLFGLPSVVGGTVELFERAWTTGAVVRADDSDADGLAERELLALLAAGCTDESAADQLGISVRTIRRRVARIMARLGARSRFQAGVRAASLGLLTQEMD